MAITYRSVKGSALTHTELDANFTDLDGRATANAAAAVAATHPNRVLVTQANAATTLGGTIDSTVEYVITGIIDMSGIQINVPATGVYLRGYNFDLSQLVSTEAAATLFYSLASGNVLMLDLGIEMSGAGSQVYNLTSNTGFDAIEVQRINYNNCTSLGTLTDFRQGLETGTGRFGGTPSMILAGPWVGGFFIATSITRSLTAGTYDLFVSGASFSMQSRFFCNMNVDLPAGVGFTDFVVSDFPNPNTVQLQGMIITRAGASAPDDALYTPNLSATDTPCRWLNNNGLRNTYAGGVLEVTAAAATTIAVISTPVEVTAPTWTASGLDHFSEPANGRLRHLGNEPIAFRGHLDLIVSGTAGETVELGVWKYDASATTDTLIYSTTRVINDLKLGADVCFFNPMFNAELAINDEIYLKLANETSTANLTMVADSTMFIAER